MEFFIRFIVTQRRAAMQPRKTDKETCVILWTSYGILMSLLQILSAVIIVLISFLRAVFLYLLLIAVIRLMGKRQLGEMEPPEFVVTLLIADLAAVPMQEIGISLFSGVVPILTVFALEVLLSGLAMRSVRLRRILGGNPIILIEDGQILQENLRRTRITVDELLELLRQTGTIDLTQVWRAILETSGQLSVLLYTKDEPASAADVGVRVKARSMPITIISDGRILDQNLQALRQTRKWLDRQLDRQGLNIKDVFLFTCASDGTQYWLRRKERKKK